MTAAVHADGLVKRYSGMTQDAVSDLSFDIEPGAVIGLLGPNGAGKTTLTKMICGATVPTRGTLEVFGVDPAEPTGAAKRRIGAVHQNGPFDMMLPALDNLRITAAFKGLRWREIRRQVDDLLAAFGLAGKTGQLAFTLSGGERRRLQVIRALLGDPPLLLLDEPSAGLDVSGRHQVWSLLHDLRRRRGTTILWTSHYVEELERNCRRVLVINHGRLVEFAAPRELAERFGGQVALVRPDRPRDTGELLAVLGRGGPQLRVSVGEGHVEVKGQGTRARLPALLTRAEALGIGIGAVEYRTPSLEDAFLTLVGAGHDG